MVEISPYFTMIPINAQTTVSATTPPPRSTMKMATVASAAMMTAVRLICTESARFSPTYSRASAKPMAVAAEIQPRYS